MGDAAARGRVSNIELALRGGGSADLASFCGQKLIIFFCSVEEANAEVAAFEAFADAFEDAGCWLIGVIEARALPLPSTSGRLDLGLDPDGSAFRRLLAITPPQFRPAPGTSATFLIDRDGTVRRAWRGVGNARAALEGARERP